MPFPGAEMLASAAISAGLGALGGGGGQKPKLPPWLPKGAISGAYDSIVGHGNRLYRDPTLYPTYGPPPFSPLNAGEIAARESAYNVAESVPGLAWQLRQLLDSGVAGQNNPLSPYASALQPFAGMASSFAGQGPLSAGYQPASTDYSYADKNAPQAYAPRAGGYNDIDVATLNANPALAQMLSGQADTAGLQDVLNTSFAPVLRNFEERILPQVLQADDQYTSGQGGSGKTKITQRLAEDLTNQMTEFAGQAGYGLQQDALNRRDAAAGLVTDVNLQEAIQNLGARLSTNSMNLGAALDTNNLNIGALLDTMGLNTNADLTMAGFQSAADRQNAGMSLDASKANQAAQNEWLSALIRGSGTGITAASPLGGQMNDLIGMYPEVLNMLFQQPKAYAAGGSIDRGYNDMVAAYKANEHQYNANLPYQMVNDYANFINSVAGGGPGVDYRGTIQPGGDPIMGALAGFLQSLPETFGKRAPVSVPSSPPPSPRPWGQ